MTKSYSIIATIILNFIILNVKAQTTSRTDSMYNFLSATYNSINFGYFEMNADCGFCNIFYKIDLQTRKIKVDSSRTLMSMGVHNNLRPSHFDKDLMNHKLTSQFLELFMKMPEDLVQIKPGKNNIGCPDCRDGGGIYIELNRKINSSFIYSEFFYSDQEGVQAIKNFSYRLRKIIINIPNNLIDTSSKRY